MDMSSKEEEEGSGNHHNWPGTNQRFFILHKVLTLQLYITLIVTPL